MPELTWVGKEKVITHHLDVPMKILEPQYTFGSEEDSENKIIHGDNLEALKALLPQYEGKINCIYIDPPYNTGNEKWIYNDNVNDPRIRKWLGEVVGPEGEDLSRHDKWLAMMYPRLHLLKRLMSDDGVIFISIDKNEASHLRIICNEIFGTYNFIADISVINNWKGRSDDKYIATAHENLLIYKGNSFKTHGVKIPEDYIKEYKESDDLGKYRLQGLRKRGSNSRREDRPNLYYPFYYDVKCKKLDIKPAHTTNEIIIYPKLSDGSDGNWRWQKETAKRRIQELQVRHVRGRNEYDIFQKDYLNKGSERRVKPKSVWMGSEFSAEAGTLETKSILGRKKFDTPKPTALIRYCLEQVENKNAIVLDSFAGSGTTAHAVLDLNKKDGGNRKFILVELGDYAETITAERVRRVIDGYQDIRTENIVLFDKKITLATLKNSDKILAEAEEVYRSNLSKYTKVAKPKIITSVKDKSGSSSLQIIATQEYEESISGTGGSFTYYELGEALLLDGELNANLTPAKIREFIWYNETAANYPPVEDPNNEYFLGTYADTDYFFMYEPESITTLDRTSWGKIVDDYQAAGYLIYADICTFSPAELRTHNITFRKIPRDITNL